MVQHATKQSFGFIGRSKKCQNKKGNVNTYFPHKDS